MYFMNLRFVEDVPLLPTGWSSQHIPNLRGEWNVARKQGTILRVLFHSMEYLQQQKTQRNNLIRQFRETSIHRTQTKRRMRRINPIPVTVKYNITKQLLQLQFDLEHVTHEGRIIP
jgi:hypothetical protein